jgi:hypothetical protein
MQSLEVKIFDYTNDRNLFSPLPQSALTVFPIASSAEANPKSLIASSFRIILLAVSAGKSFENSLPCTGFYAQGL